MINKDTCRRTVLFSLYEISFVKRTVALADMMKADGWNTIIYNSVNFPVPAGYQEELEKKGHVCLFRYAEDGTPSSFSKSLIPSSAQNHSLAFMVKSFSYSLKFWLWSFLFLFTKHRNKKFHPLLLQRKNELLYHAHLCKYLRPHCVVVPEFNIERDSSFFAAIRHLYRFEMVAMYSGSANGNEEVLRAYGNNSDFQLRSPLAKLFGLLNPRWIIRAQPYSISRLPMLEAICRDVLGVAPPLPCVINSGAPWIICANEHMKQLFIQDGIPPQTILSLGSFELDRLAGLIKQAKTQDTVGQDKARENKIKVVVALPSNLEHLLAGEYKTYHEALRGMLEPLLQNDRVSVVASPHPSMSSEDISYTASLGCTVVEVPVVELLPGADLFVAFVSSTILLALAAGIPVIDFDIYNFKYDVFRKANAYQVATTGVEYNTLVSLFSDEKYFENLRATAQKQSAYFGRLDGGSCHDIMYFLFVLAQMNYRDG